MGKFSFVERCLGAHYLMRVVNTPKLKKKIKLCYGIFRKKREIFTKANHEKSYSMFKNIYVIEAVRLKKLR